MKKICFVLLSILILCSCNLIAYADTPRDDYTSIFIKKLLEINVLEEYEMYPLSVPLYRDMDISSPDFSYDTMIQTAYFRAAPMLKDGVAVGEFHFVYENGDWSCCGMEESGGELLNAIEQYGSDFLYIRPHGKYMILPSDKKTVINLNSTCAAFPMMSPNTPSATISDFTVVASYINAQPADSKLLGGNRMSVDEALLEEAKAYWETQSSQADSIVPWLIIATVVISSGVLILAIAKRRNNFK